ncbi:hypothetical protein CEW92_01650 [Bacillaceae bacterium SAS-127]|nr:hypothetical protein CEW92_01650 [Bacillaceae bacterium SAS-127]
MRYIICSLFWNGGVEATQSLEVLFAVAGEVVLLSAPLPTTVSWMGMLFIVLGMVLHSYVSHAKKLVINN